MRVAFYCPNKPLSHPEPSGDLAIAQGIHDALREEGWNCQEIVRFRSRWFWKSSEGRHDAWRALMEAFSQAIAFQPHVWLTYHSYYKSPDILGPLIAGVMGIPYILFQPMYGTKRRKDAKTRTGFYLNRIALKRCDHAFTNNREDVESLRRVLPATKITHLPPGIFPEEFQHDEEARRQVRAAYGLPDDAPVILTAARFRPGVKVESLEYLFRSLALLLEQRLEFTLLVVGGGPMEQTVKAAANALLPRRVAFTGQILRKDMHRYYSAADIFAFPGIGESLGMVQLEAQSCGLPVVALDAPGAAQVVAKDRTGLLTPREGSEEAMARAIGEFLLNPAMRKAFGERARKYVREERNLHTTYRRLSQMLEVEVGRRRCRI